MPAESMVVPVSVEGERYDITIRPGLLSEVGQHLSQLTRSRRAGIVTDSQVGPLYLKPVIESLRRVGIEPVIATIPAGENHKNLIALMPVYDTFLSAQIDRSTPILGLGGGANGDMTGFVASTILRGVPLVQVPTTLLAMVDASVGGKTGVNHAVGKNLIGSFHQPIAVLVDPAVLQTVPARDLRGGLAECIKHDIIRDAEGFSRLERDVHKALALDLQYLTRLVAHNVAIKARVVEADPFENGERAHLNFGHTFGHAIETVSRYAYTHGECVALGMVAAAKLACDLRMIDEATRQRIVSLIERAGLPVRGLELPTKEVVDAMVFDKKVRGGKVRFVLPERIGSVVIRDDVPADAVGRAVDSLRG